MIPPGTYNFGPNDATLRVHTFREGMAKKVGHDLILEAGTWDATVFVDGDDLTKSTAAANVDPRSIKVLEGSGGVKPLSDGDRADIEKNLNEKVLKTSQFPEITFKSTKVEASGDNGASVQGDLTIAGKTHPAKIDFTIEPDDGLAKGVMTIVQSQWGIKPFSAMMGALKVRDAVEIRIEAPVPKG